MIPRATIFTLLALASCLAPWGCDRSDSTPPPPPAAQRPHAPPTQPSQSSASTRPTTQALLTGPRKRLVLGPLPLVMEVPESWNIETSPSGGTVTWLNGPTPHGHVRIELTSQGTPFNARSLELMDEQARKEATTQGADAPQIIPLHSVGGTARAREQREARPGTVIDEDGNPRKTNVMDWSIEVYVGQDTGYTLDLLHFAMLPLDLYQQDKEFLERIISTLHYDATRGVLQQ